MRYLGLTLVPLLLVACSEQPLEAPLFNNAGGLGAYQETVPVSGSFDLCGIDIVDYTGMLHRSVRFEFDAARGAHWHHNRHWRLTLVGQTTGWEWRYNDTSNRQSQWDDTDYAPDQWYIWNIHVRVVGFGDAPDFDLRVQDRYTINANGDLVSEVFIVDPLCN